MTNKVMIEECAASNKVNQIGMQELVCDRLQ